MKKYKLKKKKQKDENIELNNKEKNRVRDALIIIATLSIICLAIFGLTNSLLDDDKDSVSNKITEKIIKNNIILASDATSQTDSEYYVFFYNEKSGYQDAAKLYFEYVNAKSSKPVYFVDMDDKFNEQFLVGTVKNEIGQYVADEYDKSPESIDELGIHVFPSMLHVKDGKIEKLYEGSQINNITQE